MKRRNGEIDVLRILFALSIMLFHMGINYKVYNFKGGEIGLQFFFAVSGYFMAASAYKWNINGRKGDISELTWVFLGRKIKSFYRYYLVAMITEFVVIGLLLEKYSLAKAIRNLIKGIVAYTMTEMALTPGGAGIYVVGSWYLSVMLICMFIMYPLLLKYFWNCARIVCPLAFLFIYGWTMKTYGGKFNEHAAWTGLCYFGILKGIAEMSLGVTIFAASHSLKEAYAKLEQKKGIQLAATVVKVLCYVLVFWYARGGFDKKVELHIVLYLALALTLVFSEIGYTFQGNRITDYLGKLSLVLFLFHNIYMRIINRTIDKSIIGKHKFIALVFVFVFASALIMFVTDKLFDSLKRKKKLPTKAQ